MKESKLSYLCEAGWYIPVTECLLTSGIPCHKGLTVTIIISCRDQLMVTFFLILHCGQWTCPPLRVCQTLPMILKAAPPFSWRFCLLLMYWEQYTSSRSIKFNIFYTQWNVRFHAINIYSKTCNRLCAQLAFLHAIEDKRNSCSLLQALRHTLGINWNWS